MSARIKKAVTLCIVFIQAFLLNACSITQFNHLSPAQLAQQGDFVQAKQNVIKSYSKTGNDRLLYHLEMASLFHLEKNYLASNEQLAIAITLIESFYTQSVSELALVQLSGPTYSTYKGKAFYLPQIHIMKALNYNALAKLSSDNAQYYYDAALVEMRQLDVFLNQLKEQSGGYNTEQDNDFLAKNVYQILKPIFAPTDLLENIDYKDDAFAHFLSGVLFEQSAEWDSARLQYERAMFMYENGFAKQYQLPEQISEQARSGLIRVMRKAGGYENELRALKPTNTGETTQSANVTLVQNIGIAPKRKQLNLMLRANSESKALVMTPILLGNYKERQAQMRWFQMLHADTSLFDIMQNYMLGDLGDVAMGALTKRLPLGPLWDDAVKLGIVDALQFGARISVTYLEPLDNQVTHSEVWLNGQPLTTLLPYHSVSLLTLQDALKQANAEIHAALSREIIKALSARKALDKVGFEQNNLLGNLAKLTTSVVNAITASADTRQWQTLPAEIRVAQVSLPQGEHDVIIKTYFRSGHIIEQSEHITANNVMSLWHTRTFANAPSEQAALTNSTLNME
ncbi:hypothetical protein [Pseudoalteromonas byunsanensis]|uniref:Uncharacterized protein n=1 Tax=Pseudoalteromonas byunsanensis TaxID=327939 RepID=A0A1S1NDI9_9GAMM|nr:hypothetical protein [Pseudoalteromonas byunsanensis]OHU96791.1 hypothetical protein BIW53_05570 [Pseudoalteromonas byunsanensis]